MIVETIFSTLDETGNPNFAPMGLLWGEDFVTVRPFRNTRTCGNLLTSGNGVANVSDDVLAYVQCGLYKEVLPGFSAEVAPGIVFKETCSWLELKVVEKGGTEERAEFGCRVIYKGRLRDFLGFCRAGNAVIEAAILATRWDMFDRKSLHEKLSCYMKIIDKAGDDNEKKAFQLISDYIRKREG